MNKISLGTIVLDLGALLGIAGVVVYTINATGSYYGDFAITVPLLGVLGLAAIAGIQVVAFRLGERWYGDVLYPLAGILMVAAAMVLVKARAESAAVILGSRLQSGNQDAMNSLTMALVAIGCFIVSMLLVGVSGFLSQRRANAA